MEKTYDIVVKSGMHPYICKPVKLEIEGDYCPEMKNYALECEDGSIIPVQFSEKDGKKYMVFLLSMGAETEKAFRLISNYESKCVAEIIEDAENDCLKIFLGGDLFTSYVYSQKFAKPFISKVYNDKGESFTRLDLEIKEHPHQRSVFFGIGDVCGTDFWNEPENMGLQRHSRFLSKESGKVFASFFSENIWCKQADINKSEIMPIMKDERKITFYNMPQGFRFVDIYLKLIAEYGDVSIGATKEAGPLGVRVGNSMRVTESGRITNSYGAVNEAECWGKRAQWCDYSGTINNGVYGISIFDNQKNIEHPTYWHVRDYGLFSPNNLFFKGGYVIKQGESVEYRYRLCFHDGGVDKHDLKSAYLNYSTK